MLADGDFNTFLEDREQEEGGDRWPQAEGHSWVSRQGCAGKRLQAEPIRGRGGVPEGGSRKCVWKWN